MNDFRYLPMTAEDREEMLDTIGVDWTEDLFADIPESIRFRGSLDLQEDLSEPDLLAWMTELSEQNINVKDYVSFLGAGVYDHHMPSIVDHVISRSEFYTAYTPYQAEVSQGELQAIFEFQTMMCELTEMDIANSSMYDGPTALAEAALLSAGTTKKQKIIVSATVHPQSRELLHTYAKGQHLDVVEIAGKDGVTDMAALEAAVDDDTACVITQYPNFYGQIEPLAEQEKITHNANKAKFVVSSNPLALGVLTPPGKFGADIVVGDTQPFGIPASYGGPHCGYFATTKKLMRKMPGRLVGQTTDQYGERGFVLTIQAREQHIRRDKATSNICSNQALNALATSVALTVLGKKGLRELAEQNMQKAHYAKQQLEKQGLVVAYQGPFFNEFVVQLPQSVTAVNQQLLSDGIIGGYDLGRDDQSLQQHMLIAVTELRTKDQINQLVAALGAV